MATVTHIDEALRQVLTADADVAIQVGGRIYQVQAPQGTAFPCIVFSRETQLKDPFTHMLGAGELVRATYTFSCISDNLLEVRNLARAVKAVLQYKSNASIRLAVVRSVASAHDLNRPVPAKPCTWRNRMAPPSSPPIKATLPMRYGYRLARSIGTAEVALMAGGDTSYRDSAGSTVAFSSIVAIAMKAASGRIRFYNGLTEYNVPAGRVAVVPPSSDTPTGFSVQTTAGTATYTLVLYGT